eukprot:scaffold57948_cov19-Tisochrysis_lutea.AAC.2
MQAERTLNTSIEEKGVHWLKRIRIKQWQARRSLTLQSWRRLARCQCIACCPWGSSWTASNKASKHLVTCTLLLHLSCPCRQ